MSENSQIGCNSVIFSPIVMINSPYERSHKNEAVKVSKNIFTDFMVNASVFACKNNIFLSMFLSSF